jgi:hypothetical protein
MSNSATGRGRLTICETRATSSPSSSNPIAVSSRGVRSAPMSSLVSHFASAEHDADALHRSGDFEDQRLRPRHDSEEEREEDDLGTHAG